MKVLIIEDEPELAKSIERYLSGQNYKCELAITYRQALEKISAYQYDCNSP
jgi:DNA-binding response OmpR family regulator